MVRKLQNASARTYNVAAIVQFFGGRQQLVRDLATFEIIEISADAISRWQVRGAIPAARRADLQTLAKLQSRRFDLNKFAERQRSAKKKAA